jgi:hypothetical protein
MSQRESISIRLDAEVLEIMEHVAEIERRPISQLGRNILADWARTYSVDSASPQRLER